MRQLSSKPHNISSDSFVLTICVRRPYVRLQKYEIAEENEVLEYKFKTEKKGMCSGQHCTQAGHLGTYV